LGESSGGKMIPKGKFLLASVLLSSVGMLQASIITLTFEGLGNLESVGNYYNGGLGGNGSGPGPNDGIVFSTNSLALIEDNHGGTGNEGGEPTGDTGLFFLSGGADTMDVAAGFTTGFSFFYSAPFDTGSINVYSGLDGTGTLLATLALPLTANGAVSGCPDNPGANFCPFVPIGVNFSGVAESVNFGGSANQIVFDNITLGSSIAGGSAPEPASVLLLLSGIGAVGLLYRRQRKSYR
jgi:PEP-CTERM motif